CAEGGWEGGVGERARGRVQPLARRAQHLVHDRRHLAHRRRADRRALKPGRLALLLARLALAAGHGVGAAGACSLQDAATHRHISWRRAPLFTDRSLAHFVAPRPLYTDRAICCPICAGVLPAFSCIASARTLGSVPPARIPGGRPLSASRRASSASTAARTSLPCARVSGSPSNISCSMCRSMFMASTRNARYPSVASSSDIPRARPPEPAASSPACRPARPETPH